MERVSEVWHDPGTDTDYHFNEEGKFVTEEGDPVKKGFKNDDNFSVWLHRRVEALMEDRGLVTSNIPEEGGSPIWYTPNAFKNPEKLMVLICGSGRIHAGILSVGVCAYRGLGMGSCIPFIDYAQKHGIEVCILNPNHPGSRKLDKKYKEGLGCLNHSVAVFNELIIPGGAKNCYILAHSMGGESVASVGTNFSQWYQTHVRATALTDACEGLIKDIDPSYFDAHMIDWVCSSEEINKELPRSRLCPHRSAGTKDHPLSTGMALEYILEFFKNNGAEE